MIRASFILFILHVLYFTFGLERISLTKERNKDVNRSLHNIIGFAIINRPPPLNYSDVKLWKKNWQYYGTIEIGTPSQEFKVAFQTASNTVLVPSIDCTPSCRENHTAFNYTASSTFSGNKSTSFPNAEPYTLLKTGRDKINVGKVSVPDNEIGLILDGKCDGLNFDGIFGLGFAVSAKEPTVIERMFKNKQIPRHVVGLNLNRDFYESTGGEITIGGFDTDVVIEDSLQYIKVRDSSTQWEINVFQALIGDEKLEKNFYAILDTSTSFIGVPERFLQTIKQAAGLVYLPNNNTLLIDKTQIPSIPNLTFTINGNNYTLTGRDYVDQVDVVDGLRYVLIKGVESDTWILGDTFIGNYYTILDYEKRQVAFYKSCSSRIEVFSSVSMLAALYILVKLISLN